MVQVDHLQQEGKPYASYWNDAQHIRQRYPDILPTDYDVFVIPPKNPIFDQATDIAKTISATQIQNPTELPDYSFIIYFEISNFYISYQITINPSTSYEEMISALTHNNDKNNSWREHAHATTVGKFQKESLEPGEFREPREPREPRE